MTRLSLYHSCFGALAVEPGQQHRRRFPPRPYVVQEVDHGPGEHEPHPGAYSRYDVSANPIDEDAAREHERHL
jgi:hypothetical protein